MSSEHPSALPGSQYHHSPPFPQAQSQKSHPVPSPQSHALPRVTPGPTYQPPIPAPAPNQQDRATSAPNRKRARPAVSCHECRRKKLKCDRVQPCSQCVKARREDLCQFATGVLPVGAAGEGDDWERAEKRVRIEDVNGRDSSSGLTLGRINVKGKSSRYLGVGDRMAILDQFEDAREYIMTSFKDPDTVGMMFELSGYQSSFRRKPKQLQIQLPHERTALVSEMLKSIPSDKDSRIRSYAAHWEGLTRVLHLPALFQAPDAVEECLKTLGTEGNTSDPKNGRESTIPQILGTLILSARLGTPATDGVSDEQIATWMEMLQKWLDELKGKEKLNIETLRVQTLLLLAKMYNLVETSDLWRESGNLVRSAMIIGLHQDPESNESISLFEKEQRRKLWRTIVELDLQFSVASGMPTAIRSSDFNSLPLRNVDDSSLKEEMTAYPDDMDERLWTDALPQVLLHSSMKQRFDATNLLAGRTNVSDTERLLGLARYLEYALQGLSNDVDVSLRSSSERSPGRLFMKIMLDVQLRRPAVAIYQNIMLSGYGFKYPEVQKGALRNAIAMLSHLDALDPEVADPNTIQSRDQLNLFHVLCQRDIMQAALILCLEIQSLSHSSRDDNGAQNPREDMLPWTKTSLTRLVENTLNSLLQRLGEFGSDLKDIDPLSVVLFSVRSDGTPEDKRVLMRKGIERVLKACRETLPKLQTTPAVSQEGSTPTPITHLPTLFPPLPPSQASETWRNLTASTKYQSPVPFNVDTRNSLGDMNMLPGSDMSFQDFDFGFDDWDMAGLGSNSQ